LSFVKRVAIQAALGSDPIRECLAISMEIDGLIEPSVLFKPPEDSLLKEIMTIEN